MSTRAKQTEQAAEIEAPEPAKSKQAIELVCQSFNVTKARGRSPQWDITIGGPTKKDKEEQLNQVIKAYQAEPAALHKFILKGDGEEDETIEAQIVNFSMWRVSLVESTSN